MKNITVLDISAKALERAKIQLEKEQIKYIGLFRTSMISNLYHYDIWQFIHFLTSDDENYFKITQKWIGGFLIIGTFQIKACKM
jgi:hypothetical protein